MRRTHLLGILLVLASGLQPVSPAGSAGDRPPLRTADEDAALVEFHLPSRAAVDDLIALDADLAEYVRPNGDGTLSVHAFVTPAERTFFESMGFRTGATIEDRSTWETRRSQRDAAMAADRRALRVAEEGSTGGLPELPSIGSSLPIAGATDDAPEPEVTIMRADRFSNYAGTFLSVEARTALGTPSGGPSLAMSWRTIDGDYGSATTMSRFDDAGRYMHHRVLVRIGAAGSTTPVPAFVRVASSTGETSEGEVATWTGGSLPPFPDGYLAHFFTHYMDPVEVLDRIESLADEFSNIAEIVDPPYETNGYQRKATGVLAGTTAIGNAPANTAQAVVLSSHAWAQDGGSDVQVEFVRPTGPVPLPLQLGLPLQPLSVSVQGKRITVSLGTDIRGTISSTAAQVRDAINAHPDAGALVTALTYGGSTGGGVVRAQPLVNLSDFLDAPASVPRGHYTPKVIRIGKRRDGSRVGVFLFCQQHAREWVTPLVCVETAERLLRNYAIDPITQQIVDNLDIFIMPSYNPDGALYSFYDSPGQRRNITNHCSRATTSGMPPSRNSWGVDNNRNGSQGSLFDGYSGASTSCTSDVFAGPSEVSEPENRNEHWLVDTFTNIRFSNNIHSYGGYFMWSPGAYITPGRITLPAPNIGVEGYFFAGADRILTRIKEYRDTVILPERTGPVTDVLYSAAGNSADDHWYRKNIIAYSFEVGADRFTSTTSGTSQFAVGFMPDFDSEGQHEAMEFAGGNLGLLETALAYAFDDAPPVAAIEPNGAVSPTPVSATFAWVNEPSVIHYTLDGSAPTEDSPAWEAQGPRQPGERFWFESTTTVRWIAVDIRGNVSPVQDAQFVIG